MCPACRRLAGHDDVLCRLGFRADQRHGPDASADEHLSRIAVAEAFSARSQHRNTPITQTEGN